MLDFILKSLFYSAGGSKGRKTFVTFSCPHQVVIQFWLFKNVDLWDFLFRTGGGLECWNLKDLVSFVVFLPVHHVATPRYGPIPLFSSGLLRPIEMRPIWTHWTHAAYDSNDNKSSMLISILPSMSIRSIELCQIVRKIIVLERTALRLSPVRCFGWWTHGRKTHRTVQINDLAMPWHVRCSFLSLFSSRSGNPPLLVFFLLYFSSRGSVDFWS